MLRIPHCLHNRLIDGGYAKKTLVTETDTLILSVASYFHFCFKHVLKVREKARSHAVFIDRVCAQWKHVTKI
jgi:hypothetical protein